MASAGQRVLAHVERLEEIQVEPLDVVDRVPLLRGEVAAGLQHLQRRGPFGTGRDQRGLVPEAFSCPASISLTTNRKMPTTAWISGLSKSRFSPLTMNGIPRRRSSATTGSESFATDGTARRSPTTTDRAPDSAPSRNGTPRRCSMRSTIRRLRFRVVERQASRSPPHVWWLAAIIAFGSRSSGDALGDRAAEFDDAWLDRKLWSRVTCRTPGVPGRERDDVRHLAAAPLVNRLVVVDHARFAPNRTRLRTVAPAAG